MNINDKDFSEFLISQIRDIIKKEKSKEQVVKEWPGTVVAVSSDNKTADIKIAGDDVTVLPGILNKSGQTLLINSNIYVHSPTGNLTNCWICVKFS